MEGLKMPVTKIVCYGLLILIVVLGLDWLFAGENFFLYKYWAPKNEQVRRQVYESTKSYHQGSVQRLNTLCIQVEQADDDHKVMLNDVINHEYAEWDLNDVPSYLHPCLLKARGQ